MNASILQLARRRLIAGHRRILFFEVLAALAVGAGLIEAVRYIDGALPELKVAFGMALFVFSAGMILLFHHVNEVLDLECPRCNEMFHGDGVERVSTPFRRRCAHCALPASPRIP